MAPLGPVCLLIWRELTRAALQSLEPSLQQDLNRDGVIPSVATIESFGATSLITTGNAYLLGNIYGPQLKLGGTVVDARQMGSWTAIGAEQITGGYEVAWRAGSGDLYMVWNTDSNGNYLSSPVNGVPGASTALQALEPSFKQDLNRDGFIGIPPKFEIKINYTGDQAYASYFTAAAQRWQQVITADLPDVNSAQYGFIDDLLINANVGFIDGAGSNGRNVLGQALPDGLRPGSNLPYHGTMTFDSFDLAGMAADGTLLSVILHEMGHVLGIGSLWAMDGLKSGNSYIGTNANSAYHALGGVGFAPIEPGNLVGSSGVHWSESVFGNELITPTIAGLPDPLSTVTIGSLQDMGYGVNYAAADSHRLPGHLEASAQDAAVQTSATQPAAAFDSGAANFDMAFEPPVLMNDEIGNGSSAPGNLMVLTNYLASTFVTPPGEVTGTVMAVQSPEQALLAKPIA